MARISALALQASDAVLRGDLGRLALAVRRYVTIFDAWTQGRLINDEVGRIAAGLGAALGHDLLAWKPPGAGSSSSIIALVRDGAARAALGYLEEQGWVAMPAILADGLQGEMNGPSVARFVAPYRIDLIGAADLGQDRRLRVNGICIAAAIEPLSELTMSFGTPDLEPAPAGWSGSWEMAAGSGI